MLCRTNENYKIGNIAASTPLWMFEAIASVRCDFCELFSVEKITKTCTKWPSQTPVAPSLLQRQQCQQISRFRNRFYAMLCSIWIYKKRACHHDDISITNIYKYVHRTQVRTAMFISRAWNHINCHTAYYSLY